jgi:GntR family transcriptional regulator
VIALIEDYLQKLPAYYLIERELEKLISSLKPKDRLPTEEELMKKYSVSRTTVRTALNNLEKRGLIVRKAGKGTFVAQPKPIQYPNFIKGFTHEMQSLGYRASSKVIEKKIVKADEELKEIFQLDESSDVLLLARVRYMENIAIAYQEAYINISLDKKLEKLVDIDFNGKISLYQTLEDLGYPPDHGEEEMKVEKIPRFISKLLQCPQDLCSISRTRKTYLKDNRPIEFVRSHYRGDIYVFKFSLHR